jgi:hypothetical protein
VGFWLDAAFTAFGLITTIIIAIAGFRTFGKWRREKLEEKRIEVATTASPETGTDEAARHEEFEADTLAIAIGQLVSGNRPAENPAHGFERGHGDFSARSRNGAADRDASRPS